jgi:hypothetical protein
MKYTLEYDSQPIAEVEINPQLAEKPIKEMVEFWMDWEWSLKENFGDYTKTWLKMLTKFILQRRRCPNNDEGWCELDGTHGIKLLHSYEYEFDDDNIEITEA